MELKANFLLIGAFTLAGLAAMLGAFLWLGALRIDRDVARYGILFRDVSGLTVSGEVVFNGLPVGRVTELRLHEDDPSLIYAGIEVAAATPVRADTVAQLTIQGVTGLSYISLVGGTTDAPALPPDGDAPPLIPSRRAGLQTLMDDGPGLVEEAAALVADLRSIAGPETRARVDSILANVDAASGQLNETLAGLGGLTDGLSAAATQIAGLGETIAALEGDVRGTLARADAALISVAEGVDALTPAVADARDVLQLTESLLATDAPALIEAWRVGGGRLDDTLRQAEDALVAVEAASNEVGALAVGDGAALMASARGAVEAASPALRDDLPAALADLRAAAAETRAALSDITDGLAGATGQLDPLATEARAALASASDLMARAGPSLDALDQALGSADAALGAAAGVIETDVGPAMADLRAAARAVSDDLPGLAARADAVLRDIGGAVAAVVPGLRTFGGSTLPELDRAAGGVRAVLRSVSDLIRRIERDPARFIGGGQVPEYRR